MIRNNKIILIASILLGFFFCSLFLLSFPIQGSQKIEENIARQADLILIEENTLIALASPFNPERPVKSMSVIVTAYSSTPWETWGNPFITAAGTYVKEGIIANNYLPFGTRVRIPEIYGDRIFIVEDRMHSRKGYYHVDIWFPSYYEALDFGVKTTYIEVLEN